MKLPEAQAAFKDLMDTIEIGGVVKVSQIKYIMTLGFVYSILDIAVDQRWLKRLSERGTFMKLAEAPADWKGSKAVQLKQALIERVGHVAEDDADNSKNQFGGRPKKVTQWFPIHCTRPDFGKAVWIRVKLTMQGQPRHIVLYGFLSHINKYGLNWEYYTGEGVQPLSRAVSEVIEWAEYFEF